MNGWLMVTVAYVAVVLFLVIPRAYVAWRGRQDEIKAAMKRHPSGNGKDLNNGR